MFQFRAFPSYTYLIQYTMTEYCSAVFPHSEISGLSRICRSPKLIAACHVLLRLLMPRHSPCALISLTFRQRSVDVGSLNYAGFNRSSRLTKLYLPLILKVPQCCFLSLLHALALQRPLLPCFFSPLFSFQGASPTHCRWWRIAGSNR